MPVFLSWRKTNNVCFKVILKINMARQSSIFFAPTKDGTQQFEHRTAL